MKRWLAGSFGLSLMLIGLVGCKHQCFLAEKDFRDAHLIPEAVELDKTVGCEPLNGIVGEPPSVIEPERAARFMTLQEAVAIALDNGTASSRGGTGQGLVDDTLASNQGSSIIPQTDNIRVLALNPAISAAAMEQAVSRFDAHWITNMNWSNTDNLVQGLSSFQNGQRADFATTLIKPLPSGGYATSSFQTQYSFLTNPPQGVFGVLNPSYTTRLTFGFEQPLLQNFGTEINQILNRSANLTGTTLPAQAAQAFNNRGAIAGQTPIGFANQTEGILISRLRFNSSRAEFERQVNALVLNVEVAYWRLYQAYGRLYSFEEVLRIAHRSWMINEAKFKAGTIGPGNFYPIRGQYEEFRGERTAALGAVLEAERNLRGLMGLPVEDGERIVPVTPPSLAPYRPDWAVCLNDALLLKPELVIARESLRLAQYSLDVQKNFLKPDLRLVAQYQPVGFGTRLDGNDQFIDGEGIQRTTNAARSLMTDHFNDWNVGLILSMPIGYRLEHAAIRANRLALAQSYYALKDQEERVKRHLTQQYQKLAEWYTLIEQRRAERKSYGESVEARFREFAAGKTTISDFLLEAQRRLALAQVKEYEAISEYNNTLARLEWAKGTLLKYNNIVIAEGAMPQCAEVRAVDNEKARSQAIVLRESATPMLHPGRLACQTGDLPQQLEVPEQAAPPADALPEMPAQPQELPASLPVQESKVRPAMPGWGSPKAITVHESGKKPLTFDLRADDKAVQAVEPVAVKAENLPADQAPGGLPRPDLDKGVSTTIPTELEFKASREVTIEVVPPTMPTPSAVVPSSAAAPAPSAPSAGSHSPLTRLPAMPLLQDTPWSPASSAPLPAMRQVPVQPPQSRTAPASRWPR